MIQHGSRTREWVAGNPADSATLAARSVGPREARSPPRRPGSRPVPATPPPRRGRPDMPLSHRRGCSMRPRRQLPEKSQNAKAPAIARPIMSPSRTSVANRHGRRFSSPHATAVHNHGIQNGRQAYMQVCTRNRIAKPRLRSRGWLCEALPLLGVFDEIENRLRGLWL